MAGSPAARPVACAGVVARDSKGRLLLVQRGQPPQEGRWSLPGGRVEPGEGRRAAAEREAWEETGVRVRTGRLLGSVLVGRYRVWDFAARPGQEPAPTVAGGDARQARWVEPGEVGALDLTDGLADTLRRWGVLG